MKFVIAKCFGICAKLIRVMAVEDLPHPNATLNTHDVKWFEIGANKLAKDYFNVIGGWYDKHYPLEKP